MIASYGMLKTMSAFQGSPLSIVIVVVVILVASSLFHGVIFMQSEQSDAVADASKITSSSVNDELHEEKRRVVMAWAIHHSHERIVNQLQNHSWAGVFDGVQALCGVEIHPENLLVNATLWDYCQKIRAGMTPEQEFHLWMDGPVPDAALEKPEQLVKAISTFAQIHQLDGIHIDDEMECAPRSSLKRLEKWMAFMDMLAVELHQHEVMLSVAVQSVFGIQDTPSQANCSDQNLEPGNANCSSACDKHPSAYPIEPRVVELFANSQVDRWMEMDTYYFTTGRYLDALDWYAKYTPHPKLGIGLMNRPDDLTSDGLLARFHAIDQYDLDWINIFLLPADDQWLAYLKRWKSRCHGCGLQSILGCYDLSIKCGGQGGNDNSIEL